MVSEDLGGLNFVEDCWFRVAGVVLVSYTLLRFSFRDESGFILGMSWLSVDF